MKHFSRSRLILWAFIYAAVYILASTILPRETLFTILNGVLLGIVVAVVIVYTPLVWLTLKSGSVDRVSQLAIGFGMIWLSIGAQRLYWFIWHGNGQPSSWNNNPYMGALVFIMIIGGGLFVTAPGYPPENSGATGEFWGENRNLLLTLGILGGLVTFVVSVYTGGSF